MYNFKKTISLLVINGLWVLNVIGQNTAAAPTNDDCANAILLTPGTTCTPTIGTTLDATQSISGCKGNADDDVWYKFVATATKHTIEITGNVNFDAVIELFSGSCGTTTSLYCIDNTLEGELEKISATNLTIGNTYFIRAYDYYTASTTASDFSICVYDVPPAPANDDCAGAVMLTSGSTCIATAGSTLNATESLAGCTGTADDDVWYKFTATATKHSISVTGGSAFNAVIEVLTGCSGTSLYCANTSTTGATESVNATGLTIGNTYYIRTYHSGTGESTTPTFNICVFNTPPPPANDSCNGAIQLNPTATCTPTAGTTAFATQSLVGCKGTANDDVWYKFTATAASHTVEVASSTNFDAVIEVFSGCAGTSLNCVDNKLSGVAEKVQLAGLTIGNTYYARIYDYFGGIPATSTFDVCVYDTPPGIINDNCSGATTITMASSPLTCVATNVNTTDATESAETSSCVFSSYDDDLWYKFVANAKYAVLKASSKSVSATAVGYVVYADSCNGTEMGCNVGATNDSLLVAGLVIGKTYYLRTFYNGTSSVGTYDLCVYATVSPASIIENENASAIKLFPNPAKDEINLNFEGLQSNTLMRIINASGQIVKENTINNTYMVIELQNYNQGIYTLQLITADKVYNKRFSVIK